MNTEEVQKRPYESALRARQASQTRERILAAFAEQIVESGGGDASIERLAKRAGVSLRTVYHHFPRRDDLLDAITVWLDETTGALGLSMPDTVEGFLDFVPRVFATFDDSETLIRAQLVTDLGRDIRHRGRSKRRPAIDALVAQAVPGLPPPELARATAIVHYLTSSEAWRSLKDESGMSGEEAGAAVAWAIRTLFESMQKASNGIEKPMTDHNMKGNNDDDDADAG